MAILRPSNADVLMLGDVMLPGVLPPRKVALLVLTVVVPDRVNWSKPA